MDSYSALTTFNFFALIPLLFVITLYVLGIVALIYLIKALRIYINKNKNNNNQI